MRNVTSIAVLSGPLVLVAYLVGSTATVVMDRHTTDPDPLADEPSAERDRPTVATRLAVEVLVTLVVTAVVWRLIRVVSPGANGAFDNYSPIGFLADAVLRPWQSVTLWAGLALVIGHVAPFWRGFTRGRDGVLPAATLLVVYDPTVFAAAAMIAAAALLASGRSRLAVPAGLATVVVVGWLAFVLNLPEAWGLRNGPELALWCAALAAVLFARWWVRPAD